MAVTYIAFVQCQFFPRYDWYVVYGFPRLEDPRTDGLYKSTSHEAELRMVDLEGNRRYFRFKRDGEVRIVNNVAVYDDEWAEELAIDDSKKFPNKKRIDE